MKTHTQQWKEMVLSLLSGDRQVTGPHHRIEGLNLRVGESLADARKRPPEPSAADLSRMEAELRDQE